MSKIVTEIVEATSDLSKNAAETTRTLTIDGVTYGLDMTADEGSKFDKALHRYTSKASAVAVDPTVLRDWARTQGHEVGERGRLASDLQDSFIAALHGDKVTETVDA